MDGYESSALSGSYDIEKSETQRSRRPPNPKSFSFSFLNQDNVNDEIRTISFADRHHFSVMSQMHGSVWPDVLLYCMANTVLTGILWYTIKISDWDLSVNPIGHHFIGILVSFLLIGKLQSIYARFMEARLHLADLCRNSREMVHYLCVLTMHDQSEDAANWRREVAFRVIMLLKVTISALGYKSTKLHPWNLQDLGDKHKESLKGIFLSLEDKTEHDKEKYKDETVRAPFVMALELRMAILEQRLNKDLNHRLFHRHPCNEELKICDFVCSYVSAYQELIKLIETPYPFPLIQMARTFLFFWVFTLPFALLNNTYDLYEVLFMIFLMTYGFIGLERVSVEMEDPFGDDPCDFDDLGLAQLVFEDIYIALCKCDGLNSAYLLRKQILTRIKKIYKRTSASKHDYGSLKR